MPPVDNSAQAEIMPTATWVALVMPTTACGEPSKAFGVQALFPSWPVRLLPQQATCPSVSTTHVSLSHTETEAIGASPTICGGKNAGDAESLPSCPTPL